MTVRRPTIAARGLLTSQIWLKVGEHFYLLDDPPPGEEGEGPTPMGTLLAALANSNTGNMSRVARRCQIPVGSIAVVLRGELGRDASGGERLLGVRREITIGGSISGQQAQDLQTAAANCVAENTLLGETELEDVVEMVGGEDIRRDYLPPPGPRRTPELEVRARGLDDLQLVRIRVGSHAVLLDESFSRREKLGASSIGLLMGALAADTVAAIRQEAAFQGLPLRGVDVETEHQRETRYGEGPAFPSSIGDTQPFWGRVTNVRRRIRLWGPLKDGDLGPLRASALSAPVARTLACPVKIESYFEVVSSARGHPV